MVWRKDPIERGRKRIEVRIEVGERERWTDGEIKTDVCEAGKCK